MKTNLILLFLLAATLLTTTTARAQSSPDETAIRTVIEASGKAAEKHDINAFADCFVNSPDLYYQIMTGTHEVIIAHGIDNMKKMVGGYFQSVPASATPAGHQATDFRVRINGDMATATMNDASSKENSRMQMVLEKVAGTWKILTLTGTYYEPGKLTEVK